MKFQICQIFKEQICAANWLYELFYLCQWARERNRALYETTWHKNIDIIHTEIIEQHIEKKQKEWQKIKFEYLDALRPIQVKTGLRSFLWGS